MGLLSYMERRNQEIATKRVQKISSETAATMIQIVTQNAGMNADLLKPHDFARMSIYGRPRWSRSADETLLFDNLETGISFSEGTDIADVASYVARSELASDSRLRYLPNPETFLTLAAKVARDYVYRYGKHLL